MENKTKVIQDFEKFATKSLNNHIAELNTRYENEKIDKQTLKQAYREHWEIYKKELEEKLQSLLSSESNSGLKEDLENIKNTYLSKLELKNQ